MSYMFKAYETYQSKVLNTELCPIRPGNYLICIDTGNVYYDTNENVRKPLMDIIDLDSDAQRLAIVAPLDKFYFVKGTHHLWRYTNGAWYDLSTSSSSGGSLVISETQPTDQNENDEWVEVISDNSNASFEVYSAESPTNQSVGDIWEQIITE